MTDKEVLELYEKLEEWYGETLVNFEHHPIQFRNQVKLYRYYKERNERTSDQPAE